MKKRKKLGISLNKLKVSELNQSTQNQIRGGTYGVCSTQRTSICYSCQNSFSGSGGC